MLNEKKGDNLRFLYIEIIGFYFNLLIIRNLVGWSLICNMEIEL